MRRSSLLLAVAAIALAGCDDPPIREKRDYWHGRYYNLVESYDGRDATLQKLTDGELEFYCLAAYAGKYYDRLEKCLAVTERRFGPTWKLWRLRSQYSLDIGDYPKAVEDANRLLAVTRPIHADYHVPALGVLSVAHALSGQETLARQYTARLQRTSVPTAGETPPEREKQNWLARGYTAVGDYERAYQVTRIDIASSRLFASLIASTQVERLSFEYLKHKSELETDRVDEAKKGFDEMLATPAARANGDIHWLLLYDRGRIAEREGDRAAAIEFYAGAVDLIEAQRATLNSETSKIGFVGSRQNVYRDLIRLLMARGQVARAFEYVERSKARALVDMLAGKKDFAVAGGNAERVRELLAQADSAEVAARVVDGGEPAAQRRSLVLQRRQELANQAPELSSLVTISTLSAAQVQQALGPGEALIEYFYSEDALYAFVITAGEISGMRLGAADLGNQVQAFRQAIQDFGSDAWKPQARALYARLIAPLKGRLRSTNLTIVPHGALHYLPFSALHNGSRFLVEEHSVRMLPAATVLRYLKPGKVDKPGNLLAFGNPDLGDRRHDLEFAQREAQEIVKSMPKSRALVRQNASKAAFRKYASDFRMVHIASHGEFDPDKPLASSLRLAPESGDDGRLTVGELYSLRVDADLVTLSACETGLGKIASGDDVVGLTRGFLYAGASTIIASLWQVEDRATGELMLSLYESLAKGAAKRDSLRQAQLAFIRKQPHPFFWAAFQLTGVP